MARSAGEASTSAQAASKGSARAARHDVVVVGAGLAGLYAARELRKRFIDVLLVEASAQLGGRIQQVRMYSLALPCFFSACQCAQTHAETACRWTT